MHDRATQALVKLALEPEWEARFEPNSFGFRPGRSCQDAIEQIFDVISKQPRYVLDADIASCFDKINQAALLDKIHTSPHFARPRKEWLKAGVVDSGIFMPTDEGTPQGGVASPLLANIALHGLEAVARTAGGPKEQRKGGTRVYQSTHCIRYADDFVILCRSEAEANRALALVQEWTAEAGLSLHPQKTRIVDATQAGGFDFLGYHFEQGQRWPRRKSLRKLQDSIRQKTRRIDGHSLSVIILNVNRTLKG